MNPCVRTKVLCADEEELDRAENLGVEPQYYWASFSFKVYNIETYKEITESSKRRVLLNLLDGSQYTIKMTFEQLVEVEDKYYAIQENQALWRIAN